MELDLLARDALPLAVEPAGVGDELRQPRDGLAVGALRIGEAALMLGVEGGAAEGYEAGVFGGVGVHFEGGLRLVLVGGDKRGGGHGFELVVGGMLFILIAHRSSSDWIAARLRLMRR